MTDDIPRSSLEKRINELENRVSELEDTLEGARRAESDVSNQHGENVDHYDEAVLDAISGRESEPTPRQIVTLYNSAGVYDTDKIKRRHESLKERGLIQDALSGEGK